MQLIVRPAHIRQEHSEITAFYAENRGAHLPQPDIKALCNAAEDGHLYAVELNALGRSRRLVALAGVFAIADCERQGATVPVYELGGMVLHKPTVGGLGPHTLQDILVWVRICSLLIEGGRHPLCLISSVVDTNTSSIASMGRCGLAPAASPRWLMQEHHSWVGGDPSRIADFVLDPAALPAVVGNFREFLKRPEISRISRDTQRREEFSVRFDLGWANRGQRTLKAVARGERPPWLGVIPEHRIVRMSDDPDDFIVQGP